MEDITRIDLTPFCMEEDEETIKLFVSLLIFHDYYGSTASVPKFLKVSSSTMASLLFLIEPLEFTPLFLKRMCTLLSHNFNRLDTAVEFLSACAREMNFRSIPEEILLRICQHDFRISGYLSIPYPRDLRGTICNTCKDDRDESGFCFKCKIAVYCPPCFKRDGKVIELSKNYTCACCQGRRAYSKMTIAKMYELDWVVDFFKCLFVPLWLYHADKKKEHVSLLDLKPRIGFNLKAIPKELLNSTNETVKMILPYLMMLVATP